MTIKKKLAIQQKPLLHRHLTPSSRDKKKSNSKEHLDGKQKFESTHDVIFNELNKINQELLKRNADLSKLTDELSSLLDCIDIAIVSVNHNGNILSFTHKAGKLLSLIQDHVGRPISDINHYFDNLDLHPLVAEVIETNRMKEITIKNRIGNWFCLHIRPSQTIEDKIEGAVIVLVDIDLLKKNLIKSETGLKYASSVANTVHLPMAVLDKQLRLKSANQALYERYKITAENHGADLLTIIGISNKEIANVRRALTVAFNSNVALKNLEVEYTISNSQHGILLLNGRRIQWIGDEANALLLSIENITDRLQMERSLKESNFEYKRANYSKDLFLATLSHELRTPLTAILCWAQLLQEIPIGSQMHKNGLKAIEQNIKIQEQLIDDLLDVTRIQSGKMILNLSQLDPRDVVRKAVESVRQLAENKSVLIKTHLKTLNGSVTADPVRLQQIIGNLLTNAIKFSPSKKVINVRIKSVIEDRQLLAAIEVVDDGIGIDRNFLPKLFERFTQADSSTARLNGGLGLGLAIARDLMKLLGGSIRAKSDGVGKGATFTILLPLIPCAEKPEIKVRSKKIAVKRGRIPRRRLNGLTILIVEDQQSSLDIFRELLSVSGAHTIAVTSATEAIIALDKYSPDILVSDIDMPGEDGYSLIQRIRACDGGKLGNIPAIALTAHAAKDDINHAYAAGFNGHLSKPFNAVELINSIAKLANRQ